MQIALGGTIQWFPGSIPGAIDFIILTHEQ